MDRRNVLGGLLGVVGLGGLQRLSASERPIQAEEPITGHYAKEYQKDTIKDSPEKDAPQNYQDYEDKSYPESLHQIEVVRRLMKGAGSAYEFQIPPKVSLYFAGLISGDDPFYNLLKLASHKLIAKTGSGGKFWLACSLDMGLNIKWSRTRSLGVGKDFETGDGYWDQHMPFGTYGLCRLGFLRHLWEIRVSPMLEDDCMLLGFDHEVKDPSFYARIDLKKSAT